jgi:hypothetical protein
MPEKIQLQGLFVKNPPYSEGERASPLRPGRGGGRGVGRRTGLIFRLPARGKYFILKVPAGRGPGLIGPP